MTLPDYRLKAPWGQGPLYLLSAAAIIALMLFAPLVLLWCLVAAACLPAVASLTCAAVTAPLRRKLTEQSMLLKHLAWLFNFVAAAFLLGVSAVVAVGAQADWDAAKDRGQAAQIRALLDPIQTPMIVAAQVGVIVLAFRISIELKLSGQVVRERAATTIQQQLFGLVRGRITHMLVWCSTPWITLTSVILGPLLVEAVISGG